MSLKQRYQINGTETTTRTIEDAYIIELDASSERADAHHHAYRLNQKVSTNTNPSRNASPPVTPPAKTGIISIGRNAESMQRLLKPDDPNFPNSTSPTLTRERNRSPRVPSRRSRLIAS